MCHNYWQKLKIKINMIKSFKKLLSGSVLSVVALSSLILIPSTMNAKAAGVVLGVAPSVQLVSTAGTVVLTYTSTAAVSTTQTINVGIPNSYTGTPTFTVNGNSAPATSGTSAGYINYILTPTANVPIGAVTISIAGLTSPSTQGNRAFRIQTVTGDTGAAFQYVGNANVVNVRARIPVNLSFVIRNAADTADTNVCDMGELAVSSIGSCEYRLKVGTNAANGYSVSVSTTGNFTNGSTSFANAVAGATGSTFTAGTELYGAQIDAGDSTKGSVTLATAYGTSLDGVSYVNTSEAQLYSVSRGNNPATSADTTNTALVTHKAAIASDTDAGYYTQDVTYTVVANF